MVKTYGKKKNLNPPELLEGGKRIALNEKLKPFDWLSSDTAVSDNLSDVEFSKSNLHVTKELTTPGLNRNYLSTEARENKKSRENLGLDTTKYNYSLPLKLESVGKTGFALEKAKRRTRCTDSDICDSRTTGYKTFSGSECNCKRNSFLRLFDNAIVNPGGVEGEIGYTYSEKSSAATTGYQLAASYSKIESSTSDFLLRKKSQLVLPRNKKYDDRKLACGVKRSYQSYLNFGSGKVEVDLKCKDCQMSYQRGDPEDEACHKLFHRRWLKNKNKYPLWPSKRISGQIDLGNNNRSITEIVEFSKYSGERIIMVHPGAEKKYLKIALNVLGIANLELGASAILLDEFKAGEKKLFLYLAKNHQIIGCVLAEHLGTKEVHIRKIYRDNKDGYDDGPQNVSIPPICGIDRIWVSPRHRRRGIANSMMESVRMYFLFGVKLSKTQVAFSQTTSYGNLFAQAFSENDWYYMYSEV